METFTVAKEPDTAELTLQILREAGGVGLPSWVDATHPQQKLYAELIEAGLLDGWITVREGKVCEVRDARLTDFGCNFLERNEAVYHRSLWQSAPRTLRRLLVGAGLMTALITSLLGALRNGPG